MLAVAPPPETVEKAVAEAWVGRGCGRCSKVACLTAGREALVAKFAPTLCFVMLSTSNCTSDAASLKALCTSLDVADAGEMGARKSFAAKMFSSSWLSAVLLARSSGLIGEAAADASDFCSSFFASRARFQAGIWKRPFLPLPSPALLRCEGAANRAKLASVVRVGDTSDQRAPALPVDPDSHAPRRAMGARAVHRPAKAGIIRPGGCRMDVSGISQPTRCLSPAITKTSVRTAAATVLERRFERRREGKGKCM